jgi:hypothetical protein
MKRLVAIIAVLWYRPDADMPLLCAEGAARIEHLHADGSTASAFTFVERITVPPDVGI